jgi:uncharacterized membrane protein YgcG
MRPRYLAAVWLLAIGSNSHGAEMILLFDSDITIHADSSMQVTETIRVRAEGTQIRRGIFRDFPTRYKDRLGNALRVSFEVLSAKRNGITEPYHTEKLSNGIRVLMGSAERLLDPGDHEYQLTYRTSHQLGYFENHDELYWNVTGLGWDFAIAEARARVSLPEAVRAEQLTIEGYTGPRGSTDQNYRSELFNGVAHIATKGPLAPREGLTLVVTWPKGIVAEPSWLAKFIRLLRDNAGLIVVLTALATGVTYLLFAWNRAGRDPEAGVVIPRYEPPKGFSPASIRYVNKMGYDKKAFTAALLNLAVKGLITIERSSDDYTLRRLAPRGEPGQLAAGEKVLLEELFRRGSKLKLDDINHGPISRAITAHTAALKRDYYKKYFLTNATLLIPAWLILGISVILVVKLKLGTVLVAVSYVISLILLFVFAYLMKAPTPAGRRLMDKAEGFKLYLEVAEKDDLNLRNPPKKTPGLFESYLPFALALGVEQPWAEQFTEMFERLQTQTGQDYRPGWYSGRWDSSNPARFASDMGSSLSSAVSSASTPPGSSSGSGGGGSSGGGGGGGGGGGW